MCTIHWLRLFVCSSRFIYSCLYVTVGHHRVLINYKDTQFLLCMVVTSVKFERIQAACNSRITAVYMFIQESDKYKDPKSWPGMVTIELKPVQYVFKLEKILDCTSL